MGKKLLLFDKPFLDKFLLEFFSIRLWKKGKPSITKQFSFLTAIINLYFDITRNPVAFSVQDKFVGTDINVKEGIDLNYKVNFFIYA